MNMGEDRRFPAQRASNYAFFAASSLLALAMALPCSKALSDEGGAAFWLSGQYASFAAVPATPGTSVALLPYYYSGDAGAAKTLRAGTINSGLNARVPLLMVQPGYAPDTRILGGQPYVGVAFGIGKSTVGIGGTVTAPSTVIERQESDSKAGGTDLYPVASLAWNAGVHNWMTYLTGGIPVGAYNSQRLANLGLGHAAIDAGGAYTYFNEKTGLEASATLGFTYNWKNSSTDYRNGIDSHLDWAVSQFLSEQWQVGVVGYVYQQLTADSYNTSGIEGALRAQVLGSFKSSVAAVGPSLGYVFKVGDKPAYANLRGYKEFNAEHRTEGYTLFATISLPVGQ
jgi:hypothetical protein